jgi:hypothetical protein
MPIYAYFCGANGATVEVMHSMREDLSTWGEVCDRTGRELEGTPPDAAVERVLFPCGIAAPAGDAKLKELGFTKLVRRDKGVYENVTAHDGEKRYMTSNDPSSVPNFSKRVRD